MKDYKDYEKVNIGASDIASLTVKNNAKSMYFRWIRIDHPLEFQLKFGGDGECFGRFVDGDTEVPKHYELVAELLEVSEIRLVSDDGSEFVRQLTEPSYVEIFRASEATALFKVSKYSKGTWL